MEVKKFSKLYENVEINVDEKYSDFGFTLEKLFEDVKGYNDFMYTDDEEQITYEFYFDKITFIDLLTITDFMKKFDGVIVGGQHDDSDKRQVCIEIKLDIDEIY